MCFALYYQVLQRIWGPNPLLSTIFIKDSSEMGPAFRKGAHINSNPWGKWPVITIIVNPLGKSLWASRPIIKLGRSFFLNKNRALRPFQP